MQNADATSDILFPGERMDAVNDRLSLIQKPEGLTFGTDALLLAGFVKGDAKHRLLELGGGSGIISLLLAARGKCKSALCAEAQPEYESLIRRNVALNRMEDKVFPLLADIREHSLLGEKGSFDTVCTNPPYFSQGSGPESQGQKKNIARREILGDIYDFAAAAGYALRWGGNFFCVYRADRLPDLFDAMRRAEIEPKTLLPVMADAQAAPVLVLVEGKKNGKPGLRFPKPFYLYKEGTRENSPEMETLLESGALPY